MPWPYIRLLAHADVRIGLRRALATPGGLDEFNVRLVDYAALLPCLNAQSIISCFVANGKNCMCFHYDVVYLNTFQHICNVFVKYCLSSKRLPTGQYQKCIFPIRQSMCSGTKSAKKLFDDTFKILQPYWNFADRYVKKTCAVS